MAIETNSTDKQDYIEIVHAGMLREEWNRPYWAYCIECGLKIKAESYGAAQWEIAQIEHANVPYAHSWGVTKNEAYADKCINEGHFVK